MSELNENFINLYIKKHEDNLMYHIRKQLESETKVSLLEAVVNEKNKEIETLKNNVAELNETLKQAISGLSSVTDEKTKLEKRLVAFNEQTLLQKQIEDLEKQLKISEEAYATLKNNYNIVLQGKRKPAKKKEKVEEVVTEENTNSEWI